MCGRPANRGTPRRPARDGWHECASNGQMCSQGTEETFSSPRNINSHRRSDATTTRWIATPASHGVDCPGWVNVHGARCEDCVVNHIMIVRLAPNVHWLYFMATKCQSGSKGTTESCDANATESTKARGELQRKCNVGASSRWVCSVSKSEWHDHIAPYQALLYATEGVGQGACCVSVSAHIRIECQAALGEALKCVQLFLDHLLGHLPASREGILALVTTTACRMDFFLKHVPRPGRYRC
ncbi:hypothetical protein CSUB01_11168 [Colletotrichum sublineola]|uniref:Uncharacterized protein n=1 Tax=Colletotrichum sublineola TaxID=1173701 RepID=A0A066XE13_COLSU|nr:hypothetical protein CSUB01_11168 [Colletotrichum sublineola]